ncbi:glycoside hydrolase family 6 protein [Nocardioides sp.]|uniref:glycoside hydrolase family 6 protein n=1 Tax=Nocardioides sp. TaxID=35761 RepID=UPI0037847DBF
MKAWVAGGDYRRYLGNFPQALWLGPEYYPTRSPDDPSKAVRTVVATYAGAAARSQKTPVLAVYGIPDRDCGLYSAGGLPGARQYEAWVREIARGLRGTNALVILEPDAIPFYGDPRCKNAGDRLALLRFASKVLSATGAWVYLDAGHSDWRPYDTRAALLRKAGVQYDRGISTNVSNFRPTADEKKYAMYLLSGLRKLGVTGKRYVIDTSRNGYATPVNGDVSDPTWALVGARPAMVFQGAFDGNLWIKHPGESDGRYAASGQWCPMLADRLLGRNPTSSYCP